MAEWNYVACATRRRRRILRSRILLFMTIECSQSMHSIVDSCGSDRFQQDRVGDAGDALSLVVARFGKQRAGGDE